MEPNSAGKEIRCKVRGKNHQWHTGTLSLQTGLAIIIAHICAIPVRQAEIGWQVGYKSSESRPAVYRP